MKTPKPRLRASGLNLARLCPGSAWLKSDDSDRNTFMQLGTLGHRFYELMVTEGRQSAIAYLKENVTDPGFRRTVAEGWNWLTSCGVLPTEHLERAATQDSGIHIVHAERPLTWLDTDISGTGTADLTIVRSEDKRAWVIDYKFYWAKGDIPPIAEDLQMFAYGLGVGDLYGAEHVTVIRADMVGQWYQRLELPANVLHLTGHVLSDFAQELHAARETYHPGRHCQRCPVRRQCPIYAKQLEWIEPAKAVTPYAGGAFTDADQVLRFLLAAPQVEAVLSEGMRRAEQWVRENGPITDSISGKQFCLGTTNRDRIVDPVACIRTVTPMIQKELARDLVRTTKGALESAMKQSGIKPAERKEILEDLRARGAIVVDEGESVTWRSASRKRLGK